MSLSLAFCSYLMPSFETLPTSRVILLAALGARSVFLSKRLCSHSQGRGRAVLGAEFGVYIMYIYIIIFVHLKLLKIKLPFSIKRKGNRAVFDASNKAARGNTGEHIEVMHRAAGGSFNRLILPQQSLLLPSRIFSRC